MKIQTLLTVVLLSSTAFMVSGCTSYGQKTTAGVVVSDAAITTKVKAVLLTAKDVSSFNISVNTFNGIVQLSGFVESQWQVDCAVQVTAAVGGVRSVQNDLVIKVE